MAGEGGGSLSIPNQEANENKRANDIVVTKHVSPILRVSNHRSRAFCDRKQFVVQPPPRFNASAVFIHDGTSTRETWYQVTDSQNHDAWSTILCEIHPTDHPYSGRETPASKYIGRSSRDKGEPALSPYERQIEASERRFET